jgi:SagB-type dehydrogenase family enzyme
MAAETDGEDDRRYASAASGAVYANSFRTVEPWLRSTVFRAFAVRHDSGRLAASPRPAEEFLVSSRLRRRDVEFESSVGGYFTEPSALMVSLLGREGRQGARELALPEGIELRMSLGEAVRRRRSTRSYNGDPVPLRYLATLLRAGLGVTAGPDQSTGGIALRGTPSGGALYPVAAHVAALNVEGLERATYVYDPRRDSLWETGDELSVDAVLAAMASPNEASMTENAGLLLLLLGRPGRAMRKYGDRGMRHVFLEAGTIAQQTHLAAAALGLGTMDCSGLYDDEVHEALAVDGVYEALVHVVVVGAPA